jgi:hypothetical protein
MWTLYYKKAEFSVDSERSTVTPKKLFLKTPHFYSKLIGMEQSQHNLLYNTAMLAKFLKVLSNEN